jgi:rifampicin phosphotransferase
VRSSATIEDSSENSYAGMFLTTLSVRNPKGVVSAMLRCWASLLKVAASIKPSAGHPPEMAVVVQKMVEAEVAGVAFS